MLQITVYYVTDKEHRKMYIKTFICSWKMYILECAKYWKITGFFFQSKKYKIVNDNLIVNWPHYLTLLIQRGHVALVVNRFIQISERSISLSLEVRYHIIYGNHQTI